MAMILKHLTDRRNQQHGFTLIELLVAMVMAGIVIGAIYTTYKSQQDSYVTQTHVVEMQQNLRAAIYMIGRDIRMAGFNPADINNLAGFEASLPDGDGNETTDSTRMAFTIDDDADGAISSTLSANNRPEQVAYRLNGNTFQKFMYDAGAWGWRTVANNIDAIDFVYLDANGNPIDPTTATNLPLIRSVQITLLARTTQIARDFTNTQTYENQRDPAEVGFYWSYTAPGDNIRRRLLTTEIQCRNMGI